MEAAKHGVPVVEPSRKTRKGFEREVFTWMLVKILDTVTGQITTALTFP